VPERVELVVDQHSGDWALVRAVNGWTGWVDYRRLIPRGAGVATTPIARDPSVQWSSKSQPDVRTYDMETGYQCPNCGGYKSVRNNHRFDPNETKLLVAVVIGWIVFYITIPVMIIWYLRFKSHHSACPQCLYGYKCGLCGYQWLQRPGEILPINDNPSARAFGQANIEEQQRRNATLAAGYYYDKK